MDVNKNSKKQITLGTMLSYVAMFLQIFFSIITTPFIVSRIGDSSYGVYKIMASFVAYMTVLNFGLGTAGIRYISEYRISNQIKKQQELLGFIHTMNFFVSAVVIVIGSVIYSMIPIMFGQSMTEAEIVLARKLFLILMVNIIVSVFTDKYAGVINAYEQFTFIKMIDVFRTILKICLIFFILTLRSSTIALTLIDLGLNLTVFIVEKIFCWKKLNIMMGKFFISKKIFSEQKEFLFYAMGIFSSMVINQLLWNVDSVIIGMRLGSVESAVYAVGTTFSSAFFTASIIITNMLLPKVVRMREEGATGKEYTLFSAKIARIQAFIVLYIYVAFVVLGKDFIFLWMGDNYEGSWTTALLVMSGTLFSSFVISVQVILRAQKRQTVYNVVHLIIFSLNAVLTYFAVGVWGINGAALMTFLTYFVGYCFIIYPYYFKFIEINIFRVFQGIIWGIAPMALCVGFLTWFVNCKTKVSWLSFFVETIGYTILYLFGMVLVMNKEERMMFQTILKKLKR